LPTLISCAVEIVANAISKSVATDRDFISFAAKREVAASHHLSCSLLDRDHQMPASGGRKPEQDSKAKEP
jgi:hypothetical protein